MPELVFRQNLHAQCEQFVGDLREMPRAFIWYAYLGVSIHLAGQERVSSVSAIPRVVYLHSSNAHNSSTNWHGVLILVPLDSSAGGAARVGLPNFRFGFVEGHFLVFPILLGWDVGVLGT